MAFAVLLGGTIFAVALPPTLGAYVNIGTDGILKHIQAGEIATLEDARRLVVARRRAMELSPSGRTATDIGLALLLLSEGDGIGESDRLMLRKDARLALRDGLAAAPSNPFAWTRYALALSVDRGGNARAAGQALVMAYRTGRYEPKLNFARLELGLGLWPVLTVGARRAVLAEVKTAWRADRHRLVALARRYDAINVVRAGLVGVPDARKAFETLMRASD